ncbi:aspartyl-phosphate phosphatase Spo0E family protein [Desulfolucanica intricata]|uniref:aspartyl-phosphate phosphatase Spo0E family protein n=1 Tax=Desulfolucanica intricata TaxID=1285191 RepID=UPI0008330101|nr:aspartyl-phosphate phosphatase Spo0E family protein [Desulfolucanica intricata]
MELSKLIIKIEKTRKKLYKASTTNSKNLILISRELDILINQYYRLRQSYEEKTQRPDAPWSGNGS